MPRGLTLAIFAAALLAALLLVPASGLMLLPPTVASHFAADGTANGAMPRAAYLWLMTLLTVAMPLAMVASVGWRIAGAPDRLKLPNRAYWLAPERRAETVADLQLHMVRFATLLALFLGALHGLVVHANLQHPPHLALAPLAVALGLFLLATLLWLRALYARFGAPH